jgi:hypothetical protein
VFVRRMDVVPAPAVLVLAWGSAAVTQLAVPVVSPERQRRIDMLRRDYLSNEARQYLVTNECSDLGHVPRVDKLISEKRDWEKGCVCSARKWI